MISSPEIAKLNSEIVELKAQIICLQAFPMLLEMGEAGKLAQECFVAGYRYRDIEALEERVNFELKENA